MSKLVSGQEKGFLEDSVPELHPADIDSDSGLLEIFNAILAADVCESEEASASVNREFGRNDVSDFLEELKDNPNIAAVHAVSDFEY